MNETMNRPIYANTVQRRPYYAMNHLHTHNVLELFYLSKGSCVIYVDGSIYPIHPGTFVIIPHHTPHKTNYVSNTVHERSIITFPYSVLEEIMNLLPDQSLEAFLTNSVVKIPKKSHFYVNHLIERLTNELSGIDEISGLYSQIHFSELILFVLRCQKHSESITTKITITNQTIRAVMDYIGSHYNQDLSLESLAEQFHMSSSSLSKQFKKTTGFRVREYILQIRIKAAERLLVHTELNITEIADACGFSSSNYFGDAFRNATGISPLKYRNNVGISYCG